MKKAKMLNNAELASFCGELALLLPAGITPYDAILCMQEDSSSPQALELLNAIASSLQNGMTFCEAAMRDIRFHPQCRQLSAHYDCTHAADSDCFINEGTSCFPAGIYSIGK